MRVTLLGTGTSHGVPVLGCECGTCQSQDSRDKRTRSSAYVEIGDEVRLLIDTATELRLQALRNRVFRVDAVLITHHHADHIGGFDDIRRFNEIQRCEIPVYANQPAVQGIARMFPYIFDDQIQLGGGKPRIKLHEVNAPFSVRGEEILPISVWHGRIPVFGYRIHNFAYVTDCSSIPEKSMALLKNLDLLVLGVLRFRPHPTHLHLENALEIIGELGPRRCILTHICHDFKHDRMADFLPHGVALGFDGQQFELD